MKKIIEQLQEREQRTYLLFNKILNNTQSNMSFDALEHDLNLCRNGIAYFKIKSGDYRPSHVERIRADRFNPECFGVSFGDSAFKLIDDSDSGYSKDHLLRNNITEYFENNKGLSR